MRVRMRDRTTSNNKKLCCEVQELVKKTAQFNPEMNVLCNNIEPVLIRKK